MTDWGVRYLTVGICSTCHIGISAYLLVHHLPWYAGGLMALSIINNCISMKRGP